MKIFKNICLCRESFLFWVLKRQHSGWAPVMSAHSGTFRCLALKSNPTSLLEWRGFIFLNREKSLASTYLSHHITKIRFHSQSLCSVSTELWHRLKSLPVCTSDSKVPWVPLVTCPTILVLVSVLPHSLLVLVSN